MTQTRRFSIPIQQGEQERRFFMDKNLPIMDKAEEMSLLQYAMTVTETYTQNEMEVILCVIFIFD